MRTAAHQEGLAVKELALKTGHLDPPRPQPLHQTASRGIDLKCETKMIPLDDEVLLMAVQCPTQPGMRRPLWML